MKSFISAVFILFFLGASAQDDRENSYILVCEGNQPSFSLEEFKDCNHISVRESDNAVASFLFVAMKKSKRIEVEIEGDALTEEAIHIIEKLKAPARIRIEKVMDETGTPLEGFREIIIHE